MKSLCKPDVVHVGKPRNEGRAGGIRRSRASLSTTAKPDSEHKNKTKNSNHIRERKRKYSHTAHGVGQPKTTLISAGHSGVDVQSQH